MKVHPQFPLAIWLLLTTWNLALAAEPDPYFEESRAYRRMRENPTEGFQLLMKLAERGVANAQYEVASAFYTGTGVTRDIAEAAKWAQRAADQNNLHGLLMIGNLHRGSELGRPNLDLTVKAFERAAELGSTLAYRHLGQLYFTGEHMPRDYTRAERWLRPAAARNDQIAQFTLGQLYLHGSGVERDPATAALWFQKAAASGHSQAQLYTAENYEYGKGVPQDISQALRI